MLASLAFWLGEEQKLSTKLIKKSSLGCFCKRDPPDVMSKDETEIRNFTLSNQMLGPIFWEAGRIF